MVQAHRMLGVAYLFQARPRRRSSEFHKLLELRPDYRFDPLLDPAAGGRRASTPSSRRRRPRSSAIELRRKQRDTEIAAPAPARGAAAARPSPPSSATNGTPTSSTSSPSAPASSRTASGARGGCSSGSRRRWRRSRWAPSPPTSRSTALNPYRKCLAASRSAGAGPCPQPTSTTRRRTPPALLLRVQVFPGGLFFAAAIWGVVDAVRHYQRDVAHDRTSGARRPPPSRSA